MGKTVYIHVVTVKYLSSAHPNIFLSFLQAPMHIVSAHLRERFIQGDFNSKKRPESIVSSWPVLQLIAVLIDYLPVTMNNDNEEDDNNDDDPFQVIDKINSITDNDN